jgi:hypothetical protein
MSNAVQRDTVVEQLTAVARKLVNSTLAARDQDAIQDPTGDRQGELAPHVGMTWEQLEAVLKKEKAARDGR